MKRTQLKQYGQTVTKFRKKLRELAVKLEKAEKSPKDELAGDLNDADAKDNPADNGLSRLEKKFLMTERRRKKVIFGDEYPLLNPDTPLSSRHRGRRRPKLTVAEKLEIVHKMLVGYEHQQDVAKEFRVSRQLIQLLVNKARKKKDFVDELIAKRDEKQLRGEVIREHLENAIQ